jgi:hypothetical protein
MYLLLYNFENQLMHVYLTNVNYYNILFISIIIIILIIFFWDNIYKFSKENSKCKQILNIIRENEIIEKPYIYSFIIINNDVIDSTYKNYILKITYDFNNMKTIYEYGNDDGKTNDIFKNININDDKDMITMLEKVEKNENTLSVCTTDECENEKKSLNNAKRILNKRKTELLKSTKNKEYQLNYFDLRTMKNRIIDGINIKVLNSAKYKYVHVNENNNKVKSNSTIFALLLFTKKYSENGNFNTSIINDIIFSKNNIEKVNI